MLTVTVCSCTTVYCGLINVQCNKLFSNLNTDSVKVFIQTLENPGIALNLKLNISIPGKHGVVEVDIAPDKLW